MTSMMTAVVAASMPTPAQSVWSMPLVISSAWRMSTALALIRRVQSIRALMSPLSHCAGGTGGVTLPVAHAPGTCTCTLYYYMCSSESLLFGCCDETLKYNFS